MTNEFDPVSRPEHYNSHPSGVEVIEITRHCTFDVGNTIKYILRHNHKGAPVQDLQKALWYLQDFNYRLAPENTQAIEDAGVYELGRVIESEIVNPTLHPSLLLCLYLLRDGDYYNAQVTLDSHIELVTAENQ